MLACQLAMKDKVEVVMIKNKWDSVPKFLVLLLIH